MRNIFEPIKHTLDHLPPIVIPFNKTIKQAICERNYTTTIPLEACPNVAKLIRVGKGQSKLTPDEIRRQLIEIHERQEKNCSHIEYFIGSDDGQLGEAEV